MSTSLSPQSSNHDITYQPIWSSLYSQYQVRGAKLRIKINPSYYPANIQRTVNNSATFMDNRVPTDAQPGYWYVRCFYRVAKDSSMSMTDYVGGPIKPGFASTTPGDDNKTENWPNLRTFLSDPTVTYKRDTTNVRSKIHIHSEGDISDPEAVNVGMNLYPNKSVSYEIETATKPVYLSVNFSQKKHFKVKDPSHDQPWFAWDMSVEPDYGFAVRFGYIGFDSSGGVAYHCPIDRNDQRFCEFDIQYFVALREPRITPHSGSLPAPLGRMAQIAEMPDEAFAEEELDDPYDSLPEVELPELF